MASATIKTLVRYLHPRRTVNVGDPEKVRANADDILATLTLLFFQAEYKSTCYHTPAAARLAIGQPKIDRLSIESRFIPSN